MTGVLVDTGFLVALFRPDDRLRQRARVWLRNNRLALVTAAPVLVEASFFLDADAKARLLEWVRRGALAVSEVTVEDFEAIIAVIRKYADRDIDFADATLVWLAAETGISAILTVDEADFGVYRLKGGRRFELVKWSV